MIWKLNRSYWVHTLIGLLLGLWLILFLVVIAPFDVGELTFRSRLELMPFYGVISFLAYLLLIPIQGWGLRYLNGWNFVAECLFLLAFSFLVLMGSYGYYISDWVNGEFPFYQFSSQIFGPIYLLILPFLIISRWFLFKEAIGVHDRRLTLTGTNKLDILKVDFSDLICVSSADNYVEVCYLRGQILHKKLLRNTLKKVQEEVPGLIRVHRSHLINPTHFIEWKGIDTLVLTQMEVPVTKTYRPSLLALKNRP